MTENSTSTPSTSTSTYSVYSHHEKGAAKQQRQQQSEAIHSMVVKRGLETAAVVGLGAAVVSILLNRGTGKWATRYQRIRPAYKVN